MLSNSQAIFTQLADADAGGVHVVIENHDAWLHAEPIETAITLAARLQQARLTRDPARAARIESQRQRLQSLVSRLPRRAASAG